MAPQLRQVVAARVALAVDGSVTELSRDAVRALAARGLAVDPTTLAEAPDSAARAIAFAPTEPPTPALAARIAEICARAARAGRPVVVLAAFPRGASQAELETAATLAYLRSFGAVIYRDPDVWLEAIALIAGFGVPAGPRVAVVAPPGTWLAAAASALARQELGPGARPPTVARDPDKLGPTDIVLVDRATVSSSMPDRVSRAAIIPVVGRAELLGDDRRLALVGFRAALGAATAAGELGERMAAGLGPAQEGDTAAAEPDLERFERQLEKLGGRAGDHEAKVLLAAYGIEVTRQAVATTPSAATRIAKKAGYPVELKPWGPGLPSEAEGCPVATNLANAADVRRAFLSVTRDADQPEGLAVIVRAAPPRGREARARIMPMASLGWMVIVDVVGAPGPVAAPAPLRTSEARRLARLVEATRAEDPEPDREALATTLVRASILATSHEDTIARLDLHRVIVFAKGDGAVVVDASAVLNK